MSTTPRQRRKAKNKSTILDVASDLIISKGFENVSLRDIARQADYSPAALYKYFSSKAAMMQAVLLRENLRLIEQLESISEDLMPAQRLIELCMSYIQFNLENPAYGILLNNLPSGRTSPEQPIPENSPYVIILHAVEHWARHEKIQLSKDYGPEEVAYSLWAQTHGMASLQLKLLKGYAANFEAADRIALETYLDGLRSRK